VQPINCWVEPGSAYPATNHAPLAPLEPGSHEPGSGGRARLASSGNQSRPYTRARPKQCVVDAMQAGSSSGRSHRMGTGAGTSTTVAAPPTARTVPRVLRLLCSGPSPSYISHARTPTAAHTHTTCYSYIATVRLYTDHRLYLLVC
jgi:hypothetical protein